MVCFQILHQLVTMSGTLAFHFLLIYTQSLGWNVEILLVPPFISVAVFDIFFQFKTAAWVTERQQMQERLRSLSETKQPASSCELLPHCMEEIGPSRGWLLRSVPGWGESHWWLKCCRMIVDEWSICKSQCADVLLLT